MLFRIVVVIFALMFTASSIAAKRFYRFEDENGNRVIRDTIPPDLVHKGYDVLGADGRVLKTVPRALTADEIKELEKNQQTDEQRAQQAAIQEAADKKLLTIFSAPKDAERARERKLEALDVLISVNKGNITRLKSEFDLAQQEAAANERASVPVPEHLIEKMDRIDRQIQKLEANIQEKELEKEAVRQQYAKDIDRLIYLMRQQGRYVE